ncbi:hypothetical protein B0H34DRAFT_803023 [Crassisporium funariophilum]|nr:hypothetical protein B0H34DRAFT_803023 [Crassisporium funariophilum]
MPPKHRKKVSASAGVSIPGRVSHRNKTAEVIADSGDELEHVAVEAEDSIDEQDVIEISDDETEGEDDDELALAPRLFKTGPPSTPSPVKSSGRRHVIPTPNRDDEMTIIPSPTPNGPKKAIANIPSRPVKTGGKKRMIETTNSDNDIDAASHQRATPKKVRTMEPSTPSKSMKSAGKKRVIAVAESDNEDVFVPNVVYDSPKKVRVKEESTPSKRVKNAGRQLVFDEAVSATLDAAKSSSPKDKKAKSVKKTPIKPDAPLDANTVHLSDIEMRNVSLPVLKKCQIFSKKLVDPLLADTYADLPKLPRMADFSSTWGPRSEQGGYMLSQIQTLYKSPDMEYIKALITFEHDKVGTIGNLSRIDPNLLAIKDANRFNRNMLHLRGTPSLPLLCFSVVITTTDNHDQGRTFGSNNEWIVKDICGVFPAMELERAIAVIGLAFQMPYVPADSARTVFDVLHFTMDDNAFSFATNMTKEVDYRRDLAASEAAKGQSSNRVVKKCLFAPASPALSSDIPSSSGARTASLRPHETVPVYDGRKRQLKIPEDL